MNTKGKWQKDKNNYSKPVPTPIEQLFLNEAKNRIPDLEREEWVGDKNQQNRYRVDFIIKSKKVVIELDGHGYHSTKEQRESDAKRQRYLESAGFRVIRFTGREINRDVKKCVDEIIEYLESVEYQNPINRKIIYIDLLFIDIQVNECLSFYNGLYPHKRLSRPKLVDIVIQMTEWLHLKADLEVFVFKPNFWNPDLQDIPEYTDFLESEGIELDVWKTNKINNKIFEYERGTLKFKIINADFVALEILEHLEYHAHYYNNFVLAADDPCYEGFLNLMNSDSPITLARLNNYETRMWEFNNIKWQNISYIIATALGLRSDEI